MALKKALLIACLVVLPGVLLRVVPHLGVLTKSEDATGVAAVAETRDQGGEAALVPQRLSQRSRLQLALGFGLEVGLHLVVIVALLRSRALVALVAALPRAELAASAFFFVALMAGFLGGHEATFPFLAWRMYSGHAAADPRIYLIDGVTRTGSTVRLDLQDLVPAIGARRLKLIVGKQAAETRMATSAAEAELRRERQRLTLVALGRIYNTRLPEQPLTRLRLAEATIPLDLVEPPWLRQRRELLSVEIEPQPE